MNIDIKGIAVALAFLVSVSVFAGGRDKPTVSEDRESPVASLQFAPAVTIEETEAVQHPKHGTELTRTPSTGQYIPQNNPSTYPGVTSN